MDGTEPSGQGRRKTRGQGVDSFKMAGVVASGKYPEMLAVEGLRSVL